MRAAVRAFFWDFNVPFEGAVNHLYVDVLGLVSIGVGHLVDPIETALHLPLKRADGSLATKDELRADWNAVKTGKDFARLGYRAAAKVVKLHLTEADLRALLLAKLHQNDAYLRKRFRCLKHDDCKATPELGQECDVFGFEAWPAEAQLAIHSLAWGCGPAFRFPRCEAFLRELDFRAASDEVRMVANGVELSGLKPRNAANRLLLRNAAIVRALDWDHDTIHWPRDLEAYPFAEGGPDEPEPVGRPEVATGKTEPFSRFDEALADLRGRYRAERDDEDA
jgi:GH24 family phage-related lysozyme (muramidase)